MKKLILCTIVLAMLFMTGCSQTTQQPGKEEIVSVIDRIYTDDNGNVIVVLIDGRSFNLGNKLKGEAGTDGNGIVDAKVNEAGELILTLSDNRTLNAGLVRGQDGHNGAAGINGKDGKDGAPGADGKDGIDGKDGADGKDGVDGKDGAAGQNGADGKDGTDGISVTKVEIIDGHLICTFNNGNTTDAGEVPSGSQEIGYAEDGSEIPVINAYYWSTDPPITYYEGTSYYTWTRGFIIDSITATVTKLDEPIIKGGYMGEATYYFEYMISVEFHVIAEEGVNCAGFSFKLLTPFGSEEREFHDDYNNTYLDGEVDFGEFIPAGEHVFIQNVYFPYVVTASKLLVTGYDDGH